MGLFGGGKKVTQVEARPAGGGDGLEAHALAPSDGAAAASVAKTAAHSLLRQASAVADKAAAAAQAGARAGASAAGAAAASAVDAARAQMAALSLAPALRDWLAQHSFTQHAGALAALGVAQLQDVRVVAEDDLRQLLKPVELTRWKAAVAALPAPGAAAASHTVTPPAPAAPVGAPARARVRALVIGCDTYAPPIPALSNAVHDAEGVAAALRALPGAEVTLLRNPALADVAAALRALRTPAAPAAPGERVLGAVFFAGHGLQVHGRNYLVPCDFAVPDKHPELSVMLKDVAAACVSLDAAFEALEDASVFVRCVLLDCCRNVPDFLPAGAHRSLGGGGGGGGGTRGMSVSTPAPRVKDGGMLVAFATAPGEVAHDVSTRVPGHSPFTAALMTALQTPRRLNDLAMFLNDAVTADTSGAQVPFVTASFSTEAGSLMLGSGA